MNLKYTMLCIALLITIFNGLNAVTEIKNKADYENAINNPKVTIVKFYAPWCSACKNMEKPFENFANTHGNRANICKLNIDDSASNTELKEIVKKNDVQFIPVTNFYKGGQKVFSQAGTLDEKELKSYLDMAEKK